MFQETSAKRLHDLRSHEPLRRPRTLRAWPGPGTVVLFGGSAVLSVQGAWWGAAPLCVSLTAASVLSGARGHGFASRARCGFEPRARLVLGLSVW